MPSLGFNSIVRAAYIRACFSQNLYVWSTLYHNTCDCFFSYNTLYLIQSNFAISSFDLHSHPQWIQQPFGSIYVPTYGNSRSYITYINEKRVRIFDLFCCTSCTNLDLITFHVFKKNPLFATKSSATQTFDFDQAFVEKRDCSRLICLVPGRLLLSRITFAYSPGSDLFTCVICSLGRAWM